MRHIVESKQFTRKLLDELFILADTIHTLHAPLRGQIMASLFYEPSTRTRMSFESAMLRLGGSVISTENALEFSSAAKGESLEDTVRVMSSYADVIVMRHPEKGACKKAISTSGVPIINAGDGDGEHPTQALLDLYTIQRERGNIDNLHIAFVGDLRHGRTVHSLAMALAVYNNITIEFISSPELRIGDDVKEFLKERGIHYSESTSLENIQNIDVLYQTRLQKERFENSDCSYEDYILTKEIVSKMKETSLLMHPLPRNGEIQKSVDDLVQAKYFKAAAYGVQVRMALLYSVLSKETKNPLAGIFVNQSSS